MTKAHIIDFIVRKKWELVILAVTLGAGGYFMAEYFLTPIVTVVACCLLPVIIYTQDKTPHNDWFSLMGGIVALVLFISTHMTTLYYVAFVFLFLYALQMIIGRMNRSPLVLLALISPAFVYIKNSIGLPLRLQLSEWAGQLLQLSGASICVVGNEITYNGNVFLIDGACAGLNMFTYSILTALLICTIQERKQAVHLTLPQLGSFLLVVTGLSLLGNIIRIILLIIFKIIPSSIFHDGLGFLCLITYVIIPTYFLAKWYVLRFGKVMKSRAASFSKIGLPLVAIFLIASGFLVRSQHLAMVGNEQRIQGYTFEKIEGNVLKGSDKETLIYIKPIGQFFNAEHSPMICWVGSGFKLTQIQEKAYGDHRVYTAVLSKGEEKLFTAWWFDSGKKQTINQWEWRWESMLTGQGFNLINVSCESPEVLNRKLEGILKK